MNIEVYSIVYNEGRMLKFFLHHYEKYCSKIIIYDNQSTDDTLEILQLHPKVEVHNLDTQNTLDDLIMMNIYNSCFINSKADYVITADIDEFIQDLDSLEAHHDVLKCEGYNMYSEKFPKTQAEFDSINLGIPSKYYSKPIIFKPNIGPHLSVGRHQSSHTVFESGFKLLHYHYMGLEYMLDKNHKYVKRMSKYNLQSGAGSQRFDDEATIKENNEVKKCLVQVI